MVKAVGDDVGPGQADHVGRTFLALQHALGLLPQLRADQWVEVGCVGFVPARLARRPRSWGLQVMQPAQPVPLAVRCIEVTSRQVSIANLTDLEPALRHIVDKFGGIPPGARTQEGAIAITWAAAAATPSLVAALVARLNAQTAAADDDGLWLRGGAQLEVLLVRGAGVWTGAFATSAGHMSAFTA